MLVAILRSVSGSIQSGLAAMKPATDRGRKRLGEAADMDHTLQPVECGETRSRLVLEIGEDIVFDDCQAGALGKLQQAVCHNRVNRSRLSGYGLMSW